MEQPQKQQESQPKNEQPEQITSPEQGRLAGTSQPAALSTDADISAVDQQEGQLEHGETGGNFSDEKDAADGK